jgi:hypothetical protein
MTDLAYKPVISIDDTSMNIQAVEHQEEPTTIQLGQKKESKSKFNTLKSPRWTEGALTVQNNSDKGDSPTILKRKKSNHTSHPG